MRGHNGQSIYLERISEEEVKEDIFFLRAARGEREGTGKKGALTCCA